MRRSRIAKRWSEETCKKKERVAAEREAAKARAAAERLARGEPEVGPPPAEEAARAAVSAVDLSSSDDEDVAQAVAASLETHRGRDVEVAFGSGASASSSAPPTGRRIDGLPVGRGEKTAPDGTEDVPMEGVAEGRGGVAGGSKGEPGMETSEALREPPGDRKPAGEVTLGAASDSEVAPAVPPQHLRRVRSLTLFPAPLPWPCPMIRMRRCSTEG